jgi:hypothetical protein
MKLAMNLVQIYQNLNELIESSITDKAIDCSFCNNMLDLKMGVHDAILDCVDSLTSNQQKDIFDKLYDIRNDNLVTIKKPL